MPHIIVEYSKTLEPKIPALLSSLHEALAAQGIDKARIKTRGIALSHADVGEDEVIDLHWRILMAVNAGYGVEIRVFLRVSRRNYAQRLS